MPRVTDEAEHILCAASGHALTDEAAYDWGVRHSCMCGEVARSWFRDGGYVSEYTTTIYLDDPKENE